MQLIPILEEMIRLTGWTQTELAEKLGIGDQANISRWLHGSEPKIKNREKILRLARKLGVVKNTASEEGLSIPVVGYVGVGGQILQDEGQRPFGEALMPPKNTTPTTIAVVVRGDSMSVQLEDGWTLYYDKRHATPAENLFGKLCVVGLRDGRTLIRKLLPGRAKGRYDLYSANSSPLQDQAVEWAAPVSWIALT